MAAEAELLERECRRREQDPEQNGNDQEADEERDREPPGQVRIQGHREADELDERPEELEEDEVRERDEPEGAEPRPPEHGAVAPQRLREAAVPAAALARERAKILG